MVTGTIIGGGMIILPAIIGIYGFYSALGILVSVWLLNTGIALIFLEANFYLPPKTSLISMSKRLLGPYGESAAWVICLIFLYTIICAYTTGMAEIIGGLLEINLFHVPSIILSVLSILIISFPIYFGMTLVNIFNRIIVISMFIAFVALSASIVPHIGLGHLLASPIHSPMMALPIVFTSFGFLIIIPSLRSYFEDNIKYLKISIIVGSFIPLIIYMLWVAVVMAAIPAVGKDSLQVIVTQSEPIKYMAKILILHTGNFKISIFIQVFMLFALMSSFIGISLGLYDFLSDGFPALQNRLGKLKLLILTFLPPLIIVLTQNHLFIAALGFAGLMSTILFGLYPVMLVWAGRYVHNLKTLYRMPGNRLFLLLIVTFALVNIFIELYSLKIKYF